ncbi:MAG: Flp family type IVb pilin [Acidobacteriaceae bacterium]|jgi:pilus assembly protein Flp/PilA
MKAKLNDKLLAMYVNLKCFMIRDEGQDLIEYALLVALISLGAVAAMTTLSTDIKTVFTNIGTALTGAV